MEKERLNNKDPFFLEQPSIKFGNIEWKQKIRSGRDYFLYDAQWGGYDLTIEFEKVHNTKYTATTFLVRPSYKESSRSDEEKTELYQSARQFFEAIARSGITVEHIFSTNIPSMIEWAQSSKYGQNVFSGYTGSFKGCVLELSKIYK